MGVIRRGDPIPTSDCVSPMANQKIKHLACEGNEAPLAQKHFLNAIFTPRTFVGDRCRKKKMDGLDLF